MPSSSRPEDGISERQKRSYAVGEKMIFLGIKAVVVEDLGDKIKVSLGTVGVEFTVHKADL